MSAAQHYINSLNTKHPKHKLNVRIHVIGESVNNNVKKVTHKLHHIKIVTQKCICKLSSTMGENDKFSIKQ